MYRAKITRRLIWAALALGCAAGPSRELVAPAAPGPVTARAPEAAQAPAPLPPAWPARSESFLVQAGARLELRAFAAPGLAAFSHVLARDVLEVLYDAELELLWFSDTAGRLWVRDLRRLGEPSAVNVLIASDVPEHQKLTVWVGDRYVEGFGQLGEGSVELSLDWRGEPALQADADEPLGHIEGGAWLGRERDRPARAVPAWELPDESSPRVALPPALARCDNPELCGAARPFGSHGWQLVITQTDETNGDFFHYGCLLHDPARQLFARPPNTVDWAPSPDTALDTCGPFQLDAAGDAFLAADHVCRVGGACTPLEAHAIGWLEPGPTVGRE